ncbi:hypothetical protein U9M48_012352 [Paspalum notatum var. saurae]|uniref:Uncharacterized protein n=1 Tax=Paspalum notatum var. saurae TaxID=547442 RepID=A0AAQ3WI04_PASNO
MYLLTREKIASTGPLPASSANPRATRARASPRLPPPGRRRARVRPAARVSLLRRAAPTPPLLPLRPRASSFFFSFLYFAGPPSPRRRRRLFRPELAASSPTASSNRIHPLSRPRPPPPDPQLPPPPRGAPPTLAFSGASSARVCRAAPHPPRAEALSSLLRQPCRVKLPLWGATVAASRIPVGHPPVKQGASPPPPHLLYPSLACPLPRSQLVSMAGSRMPPSPRSAALPSAPATASIVACRREGMRRAAAESDHRHVLHCPCTARPLPSSPLPPVGLLTYEESVSSRGSFAAGVSPGSSTASPQSPLSAGYILDALATTINSTEYMQGFNVNI